MRKASSSVLTLLLTGLLVSSFPAQAGIPVVQTAPEAVTVAQVGIVGTEQMVAAPSRADAIDRIETVLASAEVTAQLEAWGVAPELVSERVAALSDMELQQLAATMETDPAGGVLAVIGVVFLVLMILEFTGVINIFR